MPSNHHAAAGASQASPNSHSGYHTGPRRTEAVIDTFHIQTFARRPATAANVLRDVLEMQQCNMLESFLAATPQASTLNAARFEVLRGSGFPSALADTLIEIIERCPRHRNANGELSVDASCQEVGCICALSRNHY